MSNSARKFENEMLHANNRKVGKYRWIVFTMVFLVTAINYLDRSTMGVAGPDIMGDLNISKTQFGILSSAFFWSYTLMQIPAGAIVDKLGARLTYTVAVIWWSIAQASIALTRSFGALIGLRVLMGIGESPAFPTNTRIMTDWLPSRERGLANGLSSMGMAVGSGLMTPVVAWVVATYGWKVSFFLTGLLGLVWVIAWLFLFKNKPQESKAAKEEIEYIMSGQPKEEVQGKDVHSEPEMKWYQFLKKRNVWVLLYGLFAQDYLLFLILTWLPTYLVVEKHMTLIKAGFNSVLPWVVAALGAIVGGKLSDYLITKGWSSISARKFALTLGTLLCTLIIPAAFTNNIPLALTLISISMFGMMLANSNVWAVLSDIAPKRSIGKLSGIQNFVGNIAGWIAPLLTGFLADTLDNFVLALVIAGIIAAIGAIGYGFFLKSDNKAAITR
jgi:MFS transporter, ACS family, D-galactonate transporter